MARGPRVGRPCTTHYMQCLSKPNAMIVKPMHKMHYVSVSNVIINMGVVGGRVR
jgi:hypothetical protein